MGGARYKTSSVDKTEVKNVKQVSVSADKVYAEGGKSARVVGDVIKHKIGQLRQRNGFDGFTSVIFNNFEAIFDYITVEGKC